MKTAAKAYFDKGNQLVRQGKFEAAMISFGHAIKNEPAYAQAYNNLGMLFRMRRQLSEAAALLQRAITLNPQDAVGYHNLGLIYLDRRQPGQAELCLKQAILLRPRCAQFYNCLGMIYDEKNELERAETAYRQAIHLQPSYANAYLNLGIFLKSIRRFDEAEIYLKQSEKMDPIHTQARLALATLYLLQGRYQPGWDLYEQFRLGQLKNDLHDIPLWQGEKLQGSRVLLFFEQGLGDTLQFVRYVSRIQEQAAEVTLWVQPSLKEVIACSYPKITVCDKNTLPAEMDYDFVASLLSLPKIFKTNTASIPQGIPYLQTVQAVTRKWETKLKLISGGKIKVGTVWAGNPNHANDYNRSIPFEVFRQIFTMPGVAWFNLQKGKRSDEVKKEFAVNDYSLELTDFSQTAGLIANLDLVITVDTAVAHLAGALGKNVWNLLPYFPDWRWQLDRDDSPWYPTMRLFRQTARGDWAGVIKKVTKNLGEMKQNAF